MRRPRLEALLGDGERRPVTLVAGPPGVGKTTLLACCFGLDGDRRTWLTLDSSDDRPGRLGELVAAALHRSGTLTEAVDPELPDEAQLDAVFEQAMDRTAGAVLVLDDAHELASPHALRALAYLVEHAPPALHLVVSTRADPPIAWERLALGGRLRQIRWADLAFTETETAELVAAHGLDLHDEDVATLRHRTEGWVAGLRLAVDALQSDQGAHQLLVADEATGEAVNAYLMAEVLARQSPEIQDFLLRTSIADHLTPGLAEALTGDPDAGSRLAELFRRGLFLTAFAGTSQYRYHSLFQGLLRAHLAQRGPAEIEDLHHKAAAWCLGEGLTHEAEAHARDAGDWGLVGRLLLARWLDALVSDGAAWPGDPLAGIPAEATLATPELAMVAATEACRWGRRDEADLYRAAAVTYDPRNLDKATTQVWETARLLCDITYGWAFGADERSRAAVTVLRTLATTDASTLRIRQLAVLAEAGQDMDAGDLDSAHRRLDDLVDQSEPGWPRTLATAMLAVIDACSGALWAADERIAAVQADLGGRPPAPTVQLAALATALCAAQRGVPHAVGDTLPPCSTAPLDWSSPSSRSVDRVVRSAANGGPPFFVSLDEATARHPLAERALISLGVLEVLDPRGRLILLGGKGERVVLDARRHLAEGAPERANGSVTGWLDHPGDHHPRTAIEAAVLAAIAADAQHDRLLTVARLRLTFDLVRATGIMAPLLAHGVALRKPMEQHVDGLGTSAATALELLDRLQPSGTQTLVEPLTEREAEVLRRLPLLMSNAEIADALHLSVNTVKTHLKALYSKLGVHTRRRAIQRARELELM